MKLLKGAAQKQVRWQGVFRPYAPQGVTRTKLY